VTAAYTRAALAEREVAALVLLNSHPGAGVDWLYPRLGLAQSGTVQLVDRLAVADLIERGAAPSRRGVPLTLTASGRRLLGQAVTGRATPCSPRLRPDQR
jgi:DNA-binding MarR family transcriptional regulator